MSTAYLFSFVVAGQEPFTRELEQADDAAAVDFGRTALMHQVAVHGVDDASVLVARAVSHDGIPLGVWSWSPEGEPVWREG